MQTLQRLRMGAESSLHKCSAVNVAWALALTATYGSPSLFPLLRQRMGATLDWSSAQLCQLFQVELALQLEAPAVAGMPTWGPDSSAGAYLEDLWLGGHLRHLAKVKGDREGRGPLTFQFIQILE